MSHDDSVQIAASEHRARRPMGGFLVCADRQTPVAQNSGSASRPRRKFSGLQSLENSQNGERISILREPVPRAGGSPGVKAKAQRAGGVDREPSVLYPARASDTARASDRTRFRPTAKSRPEMAPQGLEKIESRRGNGSTSEASNLEDVVRVRDFG